jgi:hypothetical protein
VLTDFNNEAVRDNNTGLVWERSPVALSFTWRGRANCINKKVGGQSGWRLPAIAELASLIDPSVPLTSPALPPGHPFLNVQAAGYWSASSSADNMALAWGLAFAEGGGVFTADKQITEHYIWCVRGGMQVSVY